MPETTFIAFSNRTQTIAADGNGRIEIYRPVGENIAYVWGQVPMGSKGVTDSVVGLQSGAVVCHLAQGSPGATWHHGHGRRPVRGLAGSGGDAAIDLIELVEVASVQSRPLAEIVKNTLKPSQNQYAQLLLLQVGAKTPRTGASMNSTPPRTMDLAEMRKFLGESWHQARHDFAGGRFGPVARLPW